MGFVGLGGPADRRVTPDVMNILAVVEHRVAEKDVIIAVNHAEFSGKRSDEEIYSAISWAREKR